MTPLVMKQTMALLVYEDIYLAIYRTDGPAAAFELRERVLERYKAGRGLDCYRNDLKSFQTQASSQQQQQQQPYCTPPRPGQS